MRQETQPFCSGLSTEVNTRRAVTKDDSCHGISRVIDFQYSGVAADSSIRNEITGAQRLRTRWGPRVRQAQTCSVRKHQAMPSYVWSKEGFFSRHCLLTLHPREAGNGYWQLQLASLPRQRIDMDRVTFISPGHQFSFSLIQVQHDVNSAATAMQLGCLSVAFIMPCILYRSPHGQAGS